MVIDLQASLRVCKFTYDVKGTHAFSPTCRFRHDATTVYTGTDGKKYCCYIFDVRVKSGEVVKLGQEIIGRNEYANMKQDEKSINIRIYCSSNPNPKLVTE